MRKHDTGLAAPTCSKMTVSAWVPLKTNLELQVRSATTAAGLDTAAWYGATGKGTYFALPNAGVSKPRKYAGKTFTLNTAHKGHRFVQYKATFKHDFGNTPVLDRVEIICK